MHNTTNEMRTEPSASHMKTFNSSKPSSSSGGGSMINNISSNSLEKDWPDVIKMNDYLNTGRRQQFWEEPFTKRVMDAIKTKNLEMKTAAELLGVSYGTLYGRYRDAYGCLKHPYRYGRACARNLKISSSTSCYNVALQGEGLLDGARPHRHLTQAEAKGNHAISCGRTAERHPADPLQLFDIDVGVG